jgi:hypothetical protein
MESTDMNPRQTKTPREELHEFAQVTYLEIHNFNGEGVVTRLSILESSRLPSECMDIDRCDE